VLHSKRQLLQRRLKAIGFEVLPAQGTYFLVADCKRLLKKNEDDVEFCYRLTREAKVTLIPLSAFYEQGDAAAPTSLVRFVTCKTDEKLNAACDALERYFEKTGR
jgi:aspartate/methionine/tyrosine aminotransferase